MNNSIPNTKVLSELLAKVEKKTHDPKELQWLASLIDHTLLKTDATEVQMHKLCEEAMKFGFATVCVRVEWLALCADLLKKSSVKPIAVIGFPAGTVKTKLKVDETRQALKLGAQEIDMVINFDLLAAKKYREAFKDIRKVVKEADHVPVKVILETCLLSQEDKIVACTLAKAAGAAFVKTSTGFSTSGATEEDISLMRKIVGKDMGVKASGGIRNTIDALRMVIAGADRIGASSSIAIVTGGEGAGKY